MDYETHQKKQHALKEPESSNVEVVHNMDQEEDSVSFFLFNKNIHILPLMCFVF